MSKNEKTFCVVVNYDGPFGRRGRVISEHKTYRLAAAKVKKIDSGNFLRIKEVEWS